MVVGWPRLCAGKHGRLLNLGKVHDFIMSQRCPPRQVDLEAGGGTNASPQGGLCC